MACGDRPVILPRSPLRRRALLSALAALAGCATGGGPAGLKAAAPEARFDTDPFKLGVASGSPQADGFVIWTRLCGDPLAPASFDAGPLDVRWEVAGDQAFRNIVRSGSVTALPQRGHSVHVELRGLEPERWYWYRFHSGSGDRSATSAVGRSRATPAREARVERLKFAVASCQQFEQGYFGAYRHMLAEDVDLVAFLGDYIYESSWGRERVRSHVGPEPVTLADYRLRYAQYKTDIDLQRMHAAAPWIMTWDDHEVDNDYADDRGEDLMPDFLARRAAAYQAYFEHLPMRLSARLAAAGPGAAGNIDWARVQIYDRVAFGQLAEFFVLDDRQYRSYQACPKPNRGGSNVVGMQCTERLDPRRTLLGAEQERWLDAGLKQSKVAWNILAQQTLFAKANSKPDDGEQYWTDGWDGYPGARARLLRSLAESKARNPVLIGGDVHAYYVADVLADFDNPASVPIATEFCGTSITSQGGPRSRDQAILSRNAHMKVADSSRRGYLLITLEPGKCTTRLRVVDDVKLREPALSTRATLVVEDGRPGAREG